MIVFDCASEKHNEDYREKFSEENDERSQRYVFEKLLRDYAVFHESTH